MVDVIDEDAAEDDVNRVGPVGDAHSELSATPHFLLTLPTSSSPLKMSNFHAIRSSPAIL